MPCVPGLPGPHGLSTGLLPGRTQQNAGVQPWPKDRGAPHCAHWGRGRLLCPSSLSRGREPMGLESEPKNQASTPCGRFLARCPAKPRASLPTTHAGLRLVSPPPGVQRQVEGPGAMAGHPGGGALAAPPPRGAQSTVAAPRALTSSAQAGVCLCRMFLPNARLLLLTTVNQELTVYL